MGSPHLPMYARAQLPQGFLKRVTVVMPPEMHKLLKFGSVQRDISMNDQILEAVKEYLSKYGYEKSTFNDD